MPDRDLTSIGKYRILDLVGEGAMGVVYRAMDSVLNRTVAVKVMSDAIARQTDLRDRFLREAQAAGSLQHPNVITIFDFGEVEGHLFIAMEFVDGLDLEKLLASRQPLTLQAKLELAIDVLNGLAYAHKRGIIHRDIKPANIRITEEGRAKIMDFGVAHLASSNMTATGMMVGTPSYMSPEQVTGGKVTPASDLFAFGAVLYELLTNTKPFDAPTLHGILYRIVSDEPPALNKLLPGLPPALERIVAKALSKEAPRRYQSALEMANDLSAVRAALSGPPSAGTLSLRASVATAEASRERRRMRSRVLSAMGIGALAAAAALATVWSVINQQRAQRLERVADSIAARGPAVATAPVVRAPGAAATTESAAASAPRTMAQPTAPPTAPPAAPGRVRAPLAKRSETHPADARPPQYAVRKPAPTSPPVPTSALLGGSASAEPPGAPAALPPPVPAPLPTSLSAAPVAPPSAPTTVAPPNPSVEITAAIAAYARAIESRDVAELRRAYPGITTTQQRGFEQFFDAARALRASFDVTDIQVNGSTAEAHMVGAYDYEANGKKEHQPVTFQASLRRDGGRWRLVSVR